MLINKEYHKADCINVQARLQAIATLISAAADFINANREFKNRGHYIPAREFIVLSEILSNKVNNFTFHANDIHEAIPGEIDEWPIAASDIIQQGILDIEAYYFDRISYHAYNIAGNISEATIALRGIVAELDDLIKLFDGAESQVEHQSQNQGLGLPSIFSNHGV